MTLPHLLYLLRCLQMNLEWRFYTWSNSFAHWKICVWKLDCYQHLLQDFFGDQLLKFRQFSLSVALSYARTVVRWNGKKSPCQETGLGNRGRLKVLNDTKLVLNEHEWPLNHLGSIWYHSKPSEVPYSPNQYLDRDFILPIHTAKRV